jgi:hypothetical protein
MEGFLYPPDNDIVGEFKNSQKMWLDFSHFPMPSGEKRALLMCLYEFANNIIMWLYRQVVYPCVIAFCLGSLLSLKTLVAFC